MDVRLKALLAQYPDITTEKASELLGLFGGDIAMIEALLGQLDTTDRRAKAMGVAYKQSPTDVDALITQEWATAIAWARQVQRG